MKPRPAPPTSSGRAMPSNPAEASSAQSLRSNRSSAGSASNWRRRSWVARSVKIRSASSRTASCSSLKEKSMSCVLCLLSQRPGQAQAEDGVFEDEHSGLAVASETNEGLVVILDSARHFLAILHLHADGRRVLNQLFEVFGFLKRMFRRTSGFCTLL